MAPRAGLHRCGKSRPYPDSTPDRPARSQSLYRLSYPAHISGLNRLNSFHSACANISVAFSLFIVSKNFMFMFMNI